MDIKETLFTLSDLVSAGGVTEASDCAYEIMSQYTKVRKLGRQTVIGTLKGESDYTVMIDAHIDEVAFVVTDIDDNGFLTVAKCGGIDIRTLPARPVTVHGKQKLPAVFCSVPPHLAGEKPQFEDIGKFKLDSMLGKNARDLISVGDMVSYDAKAQMLLGDRAVGKSFDDRAGCVVVLELAKRLSGKKLPFNVSFLLSDAEELGLRGAKTAAFDISPDEAIAVDVSFGNAPDVSPDDCGKLSDGAMIGVSPIIDKQMSNTLIDIAKEKNIPYQIEVMGGSTGTNADVISVNKSGVKTAVVSIPLRNMHTDSEVIALSDINAVCDLIEQYILRKGDKNV